MKNLLVGDDVTYERKMREMIVASRVEHTLSKAEILELYLNSVYLGRGAWGIEMAAQSYFGKPAKQLTVTEGALLAGMVKGPSYYNPDRNADRARERLTYVLGRMKEDGALTELPPAATAMPKLVAYERPRRDTAFHFVDYLSREAKAVGGVEGLAGASYLVRSTIHPTLQRAAEASLQEGLARYELGTGRFQFQGAEANLADAIKKIEAAAKEAKITEPAWRMRAAGGPAAAL